MAHFKVLNTRTSSTVHSRGISRDKSGKTTSFDVVEDVKFKPGAYGHEDIKVGDIIELTTDHLISKARNNPDFEEVKKPVKKKKAD